jgi:plastocyanin
MGTVYRHRRATVTIVAALAAALLAGLAMSALDTASGKVADHQRKHRKATVKRVVIRGFDYKPRALSVRRGTKVVFANRDSVAHTATRRGSFDTGRIRPRRAAVVRFRGRGVYRYICTIHPSMRGKVVVR